MGPRRPPQTEGIRLFVLAILRPATLPAVNLTLAPCPPPPPPPPQGHCAQVQVADGEYHIVFEDEGDRWSMTPTRVVGLRIVTEAVGHFTGSITKRPPGMVSIMSVGQSQGVAVDIACGIYRTCSLSEFAEKING